MLTILDAQTYIRGASSSIPSSTLHSHFSSARIHVADLVPVFAHGGNIHRRREPLQGFSLDHRATQSQVRRSRERFHRYTLEQKRRPYDRAPALSIVAQLGSSMRREHRSAQAAAEYVGRHKPLSTCA